MNVGTEFSRVSDIDSSCYQLRSRTFRKSFVSLDIFQLETIKMIIFDEALRLFLLGYANDNLLGPFDLFLVHLSN